MAYRSRILRTLTAAALMGATLGLSGCSIPDPDPAKVDWEEVANEPIIAVDPLTGVYVVVSRHSASASTDVDYRFATRMETGAIREDQIGAYMDRLAEKLEHMNPYVERDFVVDIYEDATAESANFTVFRCSPEEYENSGTYWSVHYPCVTEDGREVGYRVDLHVPKETIIHELSE